MTLFIRYFCRSIWHAEEPQVGKGGDVMLNIKIRRHASDKTYREHAQAKGSVTGSAGIANFIPFAENMADDHHGHDDCTQNVKCDFSFSFEGFDKPKNLISFEHKNSVLSVVKEVEGRKCGREVGVPATHLYLANFITGYLPFGVSRTRKTRNNIENSIIYRSCAVFLSCLLFASPVFADVQARVLYVIDGDTFKARINVGDQFYQTSVRVAHIDTPETKYGYLCEAERRAGYAATRFAKQLLPINKKVKLAKIRPGKYSGRVIAEVQLPNGHDYGEIMLQSGHAIPYEGGWKRKVWCDDKANE